VQVDWPLRPQHFAQQENPRATQGQCPLCSTKACGSSVCAVKVLENSYKKPENRGSTSDYFSNQEVRTNCRGVLLYQALRGGLLLEDSTSDAGLPRLGDGSLEATSLCTACQPFA
jgi:hypothetical protein